MGANCEELDARRFVWPQGACRDEILIRNTNLLAHTAVAMYTENADTHASIRKPPKTRVALAAGDVWVDNHQLTMGKLASFARLRDIRGELVPWHSRIFEERVISLIDVIVCAAYSDARDLQAHFVRFTWRQRARL
jgi:hypothetical protein